MPDRDEPADPASEPPASAPTAEPAPASMADGPAVPARPQSIQQQAARRAAQQRHAQADGPTHPKLAAALLMIGVVVLLFAIAALSVI